VPGHAIGAGGRKVRCTACDHEWFQEPDEPPPAEEDMDFPDDGGDFTPEDIQPIPESVKPLPEGSGLPALPEDVPPPGPRPDYSGLLGYAAAIVVFVLAGAGLFQARETVTGIWPPSAALYSSIGKPVPVTGEGLTFDRVTASVSASNEGAKVLTVAGVIVNLKESEVSIPPMLVVLREDDGAVFDSWRLDPPQAAAAPGTDVPFTTSYPEVPVQVKQVTVSFGDALPAAAAPAEGTEATHDSHAAPAEPAHSGPHH
jgi:hypothetical protein